MRSTLLAGLLVLVALAASCSNNAAPAGAGGEALQLGKDTEVTEGKTYHVGEVALTVVEISMANGSTPEGQDTHWILMTLRVERAGGQPSQLELSGREPGEAAGLVFHADALGYQWGKAPATATLRVDRK